MSPHTHAPRLLAALLACLALLATGMAAAQEGGATPPKPKVAGPRLVALEQAMETRRRARLLSMLNHGTSAVLEELPGIGPSRAADIIAARPYTRPLDLLRVHGIGESTLERILAHAQAGFPAPARAAPAKPSPPPTDPPEPPKRKKRRKKQPAASATTDPSS